MALGPALGPIEETVGDITMQGSVSAFPSDVEGYISANHAAGHGACKHGPWIAVMRYKPQQEQIGAAGHRHWYDRGVNNRDREDSRHAQVHKPAKGVVSSR